jgi:SCP-2 sterol transfer family
MERFFQVQLPTMVLQSFQDFLLQSGVIHFQIGDEAWTFVFGSPEPVREGHVEEPDLELTFAPAAFAAFIDGSLDIVAAVRAGQISGGGDFELLEGFGRILRPPSKDLWGDVTTSG